MDKRWVCRNCDYLWVSKKSFGFPSSCPKCKKENIVKYSKTKEGKEELVKEEKIKNASWIYFAVIIVLSFISNRIESGLEFIVLGIGFVLFFPFRLVINSILD